MNMKMSQSKMIKLLPSERSTPSPSLSYKKLEYYKNKIFKLDRGVYNQFRTNYDCIDPVDVHLSRSPVCKHNDFNCLCRPNKDSWRVYCELASMGSQMIHYRNMIFDLLDQEECYCRQDQCDCFDPIERTQAFAFLYVFVDHLLYSDLFSQTVRINVKRVNRVLLAIDLTEHEDVNDLYVALKRFLKTFDFTQDITFREFMTMFTLEYEKCISKVDLSYVPDLVMSERPDLIAQVGEHVVTSQSVSDKIDRLIQKLDVIEAEAWFGVDINIPDDTSNTLLSIISELKQSIKEVMVTAFKFSVITIAAILYLVLAYVIIHRIVTLKPRYLAMMHIMASLAILYNDETSCLHTVINWCKTKISQVPTTERVAQSGQIHPGMLSYLPMFIIQAMNIPANIMKTVITSKFLDSLARKISFLGDSKFYAGVDTLSTWAQQAFDVVRKHFCEWLGLEYVPNLSNEPDAVREWTDKCDKVIIDYSLRKLLFSESERSYITSLYSEGCKLARHPVYKLAAREILHTCHSLLIIVEKINSKLNTSGSLRNPPVTLLLHGDTGTGKSSLTFPLSVLILKEIYKREGNTEMLNQLRTNMHRLIYTRNAEQEYWDGYTGQTICVFDDWNQMVDSASNPSIELFELIRASNVFPYPLHMAHLEDKAAVNFSSDIIICSTNNSTPKVESLNFPEALLRRFTRSVHVKRKHAANGNFDFSGYTLTPYSLSTLQVEKSLTVEEFVAEVVEAYMENKGFVSSINSYVESLLAESGEDSPDIRATTKLWTKLATLDISKKFVEFREKYKIYDWLFSTKFSMIFGAISLIGAGLLLYKHFSSSTEKVYEPEGSDGLNSLITKRKSMTSKRTKVESHKHLCDYCKRWYEHTHSFTYENHRQYEHQCPYNDCEMYYGNRGNTTNAVPLSEAYTPRVVTSKVATEGIVGYDEAYDTIVRKTQMTSEACVDLVATEMGGTVARNNLYRVYLEAQTGNESAVDIPLGHCLFLKGNVAIMPKHFVFVMQSYDPASIVYFSNPLVDKVFPTRVKDIQFNEYVDKYSRSKDLVSFQLFHSRDHKDITNMFATSSSVKYAGTTKVSLLTLNCISPKYPLVVDRHQSVGVSCIKHLEQPIEYKLTNTGDFIKIHESWEYHLETQKGDCGSPLFVLNDSIAPGKIIGIHVAGSKSAGYSTCLFHEDVLQICKQYNVFAQVHTLDLNIGKNPYPECELLYLGDINSPIVQPSNSKIIPSVVHNLIVEPKTDLTWLRPNNLNGERFDPLEYRTKRMGKSSVAIPLDLIDISKRGLLNEFKRVYLQSKELLGGRFKCPFSIEETCLGIDGEEFVNAIKRDTSAGFPFTQMGITRSQIFGTNEVYDINTPLALEIFELVDFYEECANNGIVLDHYFVDTLKDERKPKEKCHKTRMFAAGPIDYLIWSKRWFNGVVAVISELRNKIHISVGTNVYSSDWDMMTRSLLRKSEHFVAGDFEGFDASEQAYILKSALDVLIEFSQYIFGEDPYARKQMQAIAVGLVYSHHISGKHVFQWLKSLPSGHYLTAIANSCFVLLSLSSAYLLALRKNNQVVTDLDIDYFWKNFGVVSYGDDHVIAVPESCLGFYNQNTLVGLLREFGLYYTDEQKGAKGVANFRPITEISYLKRNFVFNEKLGRWLSPLDINVILETPMWIRKCADHKLQTFDNIEFALRELSQHEQQVWDEWSPKLLRLAEEKCLMVSKFQDKNSTLLFVLQTVMAQSSDVICEDEDNKRGFNLLQLLSEEKAVDIYPYHTGSALAAPEHPVTLARLRREGALEAQSNSPAETTNLNLSHDNTNEIKDQQYSDQISTDQREQITTFENDLSVVTQDVPMPTPLEVNLRSMHTDDNHHTIVSFLKRPQIIREFSWDNSLKRNADVFEKIRVPFDMIQRQFKQKLQGFMSFRATAVITVQFQTQPFQAGRFLMAAVPLPSLIGKRTKLIENRISNLCLLNHVQADIAKQTQVELRVPYISPAVAYDLVQGRYDWAEVVGKVYSPVTSVGTTAVEGIVYVHFEDVQLGAPTSQPVFESSQLLAQAGEAKSKKKIPYEPDALTDFRLRAQESGVTAENSSRATGGLRKINSKISEYVGFTKPITDALDTYLLKPLDDFVGPILNVFGFSKPLVEGDDKLLRPSTTFSTFDGQDRALTLATSADVNAPFIPHLNGTSLDEMSFDYLKKIPQYIANFKYSTTNNKNDILHWMYVRPTYRTTEQVVIRTDNQEMNVKQPSHLAYIVQPFAYWTGSLVLTYKFVKTDYHSGRVEISYHPNCDPINVNGEVSSTTDFDMAYRYIVDLRDKSEVSLRIPYMSVTPFKKNIDQAHYTMTRRYPNVAYNSGVVVVRALTPLKASNAVVSGNVEVLVEYNAGNDFQVMNPVTCRYNPVTPLEETPSSKITNFALDLNQESDWSGYYSDEIEAQSGEASTAGLAITRQQAIEGEDPPSITGNNGETQPSSSSALVTGEKFTNFRDLTHRTNFVLLLKDMGMFTIPVSNMYIPPPLCAIKHDDELYFTPYSRSNSSLGYVGAMYALGRGSVNVRICPKDLKGFLGATLKFDDTWPVDCMYPLAIENSAIKGLAEYHLPYYCRTYQFDHLKYNKSSLYDLIFQVSTAYQEKITAAAAVSGGDDIAFGYFIGTPLCLTRESESFSSGADPFSADWNSGSTLDSYITWDDISIS